MQPDGTAGVLGAPVLDAKPGRDGAIDVAKGLGIILVVFGHNWIVAHDIGELFRIVYSFHVPLFFFLAGIYFKEQQGFYNLLASKADALLKPYLVVLLLFWLLRASSKLPPLPEYLAGILYATGSTIPITALWFLPHLFVCFLFSWLMLRLSARAPYQRAVRFALVIVLVVVGNLSLTLSREWFSGNAYLQFYLRAGAPRPLGAPFSLDLVCISSAFLLLGFLLSKQARALRFSWLGVLSAGLLFCVLHYLFDYTIDLNMRTYGQLLVSTLQAAAGVYLVLSISCLLQRVHGLFRLFSFIGAGTLFILLFHSIMQADAGAVLLRLAVPIYLAALLSLLLALAVPLGLFELAKRYRLLAWFFLPRWRPAPPLQKAPHH